jgi:hypothetical protein
MIAVVMTTLLSLLDTATNDPYPASIPAATAIVASHAGRGGDAVFVARPEPARISRSVYREL